MLLHCGNFDDNDREGPRGPKNFVNVELQDLPEENPPQNLKELSDSLTVAHSIVFKCLEI